MVKFVIDLRQVGAFLRFPPPKKLTHDITEILLKKVLITTNQTNIYLFYGSFILNIKVSKMGNQKLFPQHVSYWYGDRIVTWYNVPYMTRKQCEGSKLLSDYCLLNFQRTVFQLYSGQGFQFDIYVFIPN